MLALGESKAASADMAGQHASCALYNKQQCCRGCCCGLHVVCLVLLLHGSGASIRGVQEMIADSGAVAASLC